MLTTTPTTSLACDFNAHNPFERLDALCTRMMCSDSGVSQRHRKHVRVNVPMAFTGSECVQWLLANAHVDDSAEALHLANTLSLHGYLFSVIDKDISVKDDNTLYRFQIPYFWPSHSGVPDNVEYAVFLCKRLMRNEQRHGLEQYEVEEYNKMANILDHQWDYITAQAEMQLKLHKEKKKSEKAVLDSQERAYWRIFRPPPATQSLIEQYLKPQIKTRRKSSRDYRQELARLNQLLIKKPYLAKHSDRHNYFCSWSSQYQDYDPMIAGCDPSNPWISSDQAYWTLNSDNIEVPTERRVKRWGFSAQELIKDPIGREIFEKFLETEFSSENIRFWLAIQDLKKAPQSEIEDKIEFLYNEYLAPGAASQVNIFNKTLETARIAKEDTSKSTSLRRWCFNAPEEEIFNLMSRDSYSRFVRSDIYKNCLEAAKQQGKGRGWRNILRPGTEASKKMSAAPPRNAGTRLNREDSQGANINAKIVNDGPSGVK